MAPFNHLLIYGTPSPYLGLYKGTSNSYTSVGVGDFSGLTGRVDFAEYSSDGTYLAICSQTSPYLELYKRSDNSYTRLTNPTTMPNGEVQFAAWYGSNLLAISYTNTPNIIIYYRTGDTFTALTSPLSLIGDSPAQMCFSPSGHFLYQHYYSPAIYVYTISGSGSSTTFTRVTSPGISYSDGQTYSVAQSDDGVYFAVGITVSPYVKIYKRSGDTWSALSNPATLPTGVARHLRFSPGSEYLAVSHVNSPYLSVYRRSGDTFTKLTNPATLPSIASLPKQPYFSSTANQLSIRTDSSPYIIVYDISGDSITAQPNAGLVGLTTTYGGVLSPDITIFVNECVVDGMFPDVYAEGSMVVSINTDFTGSIPVFYCDIHGGWDISGEIPEIFCESLAQVTTVTEIEGELPDIFADILATVSDTAAIEGFIGYLSADISQTLVNRCFVEGTIPVFRADITAHGRFHSIDGKIPELYGDIQGDFGTNNFATLAYTRQW